MTTTFVNGYNVTGNHATVGREYRVCNAGGKVLVRSANGIEHAMAIAAARPPGDVPEPAPKPKPVFATRPPPLKVVTAPATEPTKPKATGRKKVK